MKRALPALLLAAAIAGPARAGDSTPEVYRGLFQIVKPITPDWAIGAVLGGVQNTISDLQPGVQYGNSQSLIAVPVAFDHRLNDWASMEAYLMFNLETGREVLFNGQQQNLDDQLEIRPVIGLTLHTHLAESVEIGAWSRYEARFLNVTGDEDFENRVRVRLYADYAIGQDMEAGTGWHLRAEVEPKFVAGTDPEIGRYAYVNAIMPRAVIGYRFDPSLFVDLKYSHEWSRPEPGAGWEHSNDMFTLHLTKIIGLTKMMAWRPAQIDE